MNEKEYNYIKLDVRFEFSSIFRQSNYLEQVIITGTRIRKKDFMDKLKKFIKELKQ